MEPSDLVVVESGARLTQWREARKSVARPSTTVIQGADEPSPEFVARVRTHVDGLVTDGSPIGRFTLVGGEDWSIPTLQARLAILRNAREAPLPANGVELYLQHGSQAPTDVEAGDATR
ncbi:MAG: hypothetical protein OEZ06_00675 [Myxococcales bacterium]|nr:hypothetical protein [Myxococcales bacterium]